MNEPSESLRRAPKLNALQVAADLWVIDHPDQIDSGAWRDPIWRETWPEGATESDIIQSIARVDLNRMHACMVRDRYVTPAMVAEEYRKATAITPTEAHLTLPEVKELPAPPTEPGWPFYAPVSSSEFWIVFGLFLFCWAALVLAVVGGAYVCGALK